MNSGTALYCMSMRGVCVCGCVCACVRVCLCASVLCGRVCAHAWFILYLELQNDMPNSLLISIHDSSAHILGGALCSCRLMCLPGQGPSPMSQLL